MDIAITVVTYQQNKVSPESAIITRARLIHLLKLNGFQLRGPNTYCAPDGTWDILLRFEDI